MNLKTITVKTKATERTRSKERTYESQVLEFGDHIQFYLTSITRRQIEVYDHFKLCDIASVNYEGHTYVITKTETSEGKSKHPILYGTLVA